MSRFEICLTQRNSGHNPRATQGSHGQHKDNPEQSSGKGQPKENLDATRGQSRGISGLPGSKKNPDLYLVGNLFLNR